MYAIRSYYEQHPGLALFADHRDETLGHIHRDAELFEGDAAHQLLTGRGGLAHLHMAVGDDAAVGGLDAGVLQLFRRLGQAGIGGVLAGTGRFQAGGGFIQLGLGGQLAGK